MATLTILSTNQQIPITPGISILNTLLRNDVKIPHKCGGKMQCGTCKIAIISGDGLSPMKEDEKFRLSKVDSKENDRLACQTFTYKDVTIDF